MCKKEQSEENKKGGPDITSLVGRSSCVHVKEQYIAISERGKDESKSIYFRFLASGLNPLRGKSFEEITHKVFTNVGGIWAIFYYPGNEKKKRQKSNS